MGVYIFENPKTGEVKEIVLGINDKHEYSEKGIKWNRVFTVPQASTNTKIDAYDSKDFILKTRDKKGNLGNLNDLSAELSSKRAQRYGEDPVKKEYFDNYAKKRKGKRHPKEKIDPIKNDITVDISTRLKKMLD